MTLDPDAAARVASFGDLPPMRVRGLAAVRAAIEGAPLPENMPAMCDVTETLADSVPVRIYRPTTDSVGPVLVYFHGGGLVMGSNHSFEPLARALAAASGAIVVAVDYRLAPESPPPAQFDDAYAATEWAARQPWTDDLVVVGDSAGGAWRPGWRWPRVIATVRAFACRCCCIPVWIAT